MKRRLVISFLVVSCLFLGSTASPVFSHAGIDQNGESVATQIGASHNFISDPRGANADEQSDMTTEEEELGKLKKALEEARDEKTENSKLKEKINEIIKKLDAAIKALQDGKMGDALDWKDKALKQLEGLILDAGKGGEKERKELVPALKVVVDGLKASIDREAKEELVAFLKSFGNLLGALSVRYEHLREELGKINDKLLKLSTAERAKNTKEAIEWKKEISRELEALLKDKEVRKNKEDVDDITSFNDWWKKEIEAEKKGLKTWNLNATDELLSWSWGTLNVLARECPELKDEIDKIKGKIDNIEKMLKEGKTEEAIKVKEELQKELEAMRKSLTGTVVERCLRDIAWLLGVTAASIEEEKALGKTGMKESPIKKIRQVVDEYNSALAQIPSLVKQMLGTELINAHITFMDGSVVCVGLVTYDGVITLVSDKPFTYPTMALYISEEVVNRIGTATDPSAALLQAWGTDIKCQGLTLQTKFKIAIASVGIRLYSLVKPAQKSAKKMEAQVHKVRENGVKDWLIFA